MFFSPLLRKKGLTTLFRGESGQSFRVTHPFHPFRDDEFEVASRYRFQGLERIFFHDPHGRPRSLPAAWTSLAEPDPFLVVSAGRAWFRVDDLLELSRLINGDKK